MAVLRRAIAGELTVEDMRPMPGDLADRIREELEKHPKESWDEALWVIGGLDLLEDEDE